LKGRCHTRSMPDGASACCSAAPAAPLARSPLHHCGIVADAVPLTGSLTKARIPLCTPAAARPPPPSRWRSRHHRLRRPGLSRCPRRTGTDQTGSLRRRLDPIGRRRTFGTGRARSPRTVRNTWSAGAVREAMQQRSSGRSSTTCHRRTASCGTLHRLSTGDGRGGTLKARFQQSVPVPRLRKPEGPNEDRGKRCRPGQPPHAKRSHHHRPRRITSLPWGTRGRHEERGPTVHLLADEPVVSGQQYPSPTSTGASRANSTTSPATSASLLSAMTPPFK
jgi:hypothetical protein